MIPLRNLKESFVGSVVRFVYNGGTHLGDTRYVRVESHTSRSMKGFDIVAGLWRNFSYSKAAKVKQLEQDDFTRVHFTEARKTVAANIHAFDLEALAELYKVVCPTAVGVTPDSNGGYITYIKEPALNAAGRSMTVAEARKLHEELTKLLEIHD